MFLNKKIVKIETLGEKLKKLREGKDLSLEKVEKKINIQKKYLEALENGDYRQLPGEVYVKNFLIQYAAFLGLDRVKTVKLYDQERIPVVLRKNSIKKNLVLSQILWKSFKVLILFLILFYLSWGIKKIIFPPYLTIASPDDNFITRESSIKIKGETEEDVTVKVNDKLATSNLKGKFEEIVDLRPGLNIIEISAAKKYSREKKIVRRIMFIQP